MNLSLQERFGSVFNNPEFYPIGWSDDGLFAYKMIHCDGGSGCCSNRIVIQSSKSDKIIDHFMLPSDEDYFEGTEEDKWRENTRKINAFLNKYDYSLINHFSHWQFLELGYLIKRAKKYFKLFSSIEKIINFLKLSSIPVPYNLGQTTFIFKKNNE